MKNYDIKQVKTIEELQEVFDKGFKNLFDQCFDTKPYYLKYSDDELFKIYENHIKFGFVILAYNNCELVGFAGSRLLIKDEYVSQDIISKFINPEKIMYHSDLGVKISERGKGLAKLLMQKSIELTPNNMDILMRTKDDNFESINFHKKFGFENTLLIQKGNSKGVQKDNRVYYILKRNEQLV